MEAHVDSDCRGRGDPSSQFFHGSRGSLVNPWAPQKVISNSRLSSSPTSLFYKKKEQP